MTCPTHETIEHYVCDRLSVTERTAFEGHVQGCPGCAERLEEARANEQVLAELRTVSQALGDSPQDSAGGSLSVGEAQTLVGDRYQIVRRVGQGAAGQVFQAIDGRLERPVAIKFLPADAARPAEQAWREARLMGQLNHPHIAQVHEVGQRESHRFIVMEWVEGVPITDAWTDLPLEQRLRLYCGVLEAIRAAHQRGIVHRDLKPSNILVTAQSQAKVLDFGIAVETSAQAGLETAVYRGTPAYSAPEQVTRPVQIGPATDVFALGILLYQLLTDSLPFPQTTMPELFAAIRSQYPEFPTAIVQTVPIPLQDICLKALEKNAGQRYADARSLLDDVNRYLRGERVWSKPSFVADKVQQEVFHHRQKLKVWHENGLLTERECDKLEGIYERLVAPSDPSIIEARELSLSQVWLYFGGWIAIMGSLVLFLGTWDPVPDYIWPLPVTAAMLLLLLFGVWRWRCGESRLAVGFLATSNLLFPMAVLLMLWQWHILDSARYPWGAELSGAEPVVQGLRAEPPEQNLQEEPSRQPPGNAQMFTAAALWLGCSLLFLRTTRSSIFVVFSTVAFLAGLTVCYTIAGMVKEEWPQEVIAGRYLYPGFALFLLGVLVDRRKWAHHAVPLCVAGLALIVGPLSTIASSDATLFGWLGYTPGFLSDNEDELMGLSLIANGLFYLALAGLCRRLNTLLQRRLAQILSWLGPLHILGVLRTLDSNTWQVDDSHQLVYRILLPIGSVAFVFGSISRQMKSFFFSGLAGIAASVYRLTTKHWDEFFAWPVSLIVAGTLCMLVSWLVPRLQASTRLRGPRTAPAPPGVPPVSSRRPAQGQGPS
ncbi:MAG: protein kinase [Planctomycetes bacterium]|nr:protein kinase [Planctomycetota bacterium]